MHEADSSGRTDGPDNRAEDPWGGFRGQLRIRNILLSIVAIEALTFDALRWWNVI
jgi:hypothetical protein